MIGQSLDFVSLILVSVSSIGSERLTEKDSLRVSSLELSLVSYGSSNKSKKASNKPKNRTSPPRPLPCSHTQLHSSRLGKKGLHITPSGLSVKTDKRFDREDYIDATQRGIIKTMGAASFGQVDEKGNHLDKGMIERKMSGGSSPSLGNGEEKEKEKEKKSRFGLRRGLSGSK